MTRPEYDALAFRLVGYVLGPCLLAYAVYSMIYNSHKSWYSFVISTLCSFVYGAGFATLIPQLIINYKLKSVAHIPLKAMLYKTLSTVIDGAFGFSQWLDARRRLLLRHQDAAAPSAGVLQR